MPGVLPDELLAELRKHPLGARPRHGSMEAWNVDKLQFVECKRQRPSTTPTTTEVCRTFYVFAPRIQIPHDARRHARMREQQW